MWNSDKFAAPPTQFRPGHVTPRKLDAEALTRTAGGFTVQLPSKAPVPTPSVYKGKLYVSGGFHSKEFYCLDAEHGRLAWGLNLDDDGPTSAACADDVIVINLADGLTLRLQDRLVGRWQRLPGGLQGGQADHGGGAPGWDGNAGAGGPLRAAAGAIADVSAAAGRPGSIS